MVAIDPQRSKLGDFQAAEPYRLVDDTFIRSELEVLQSPTLLVAVINALNLSNEPEFRSQSFIIDWNRTLGLDWLRNQISGIFDTTPSVITDEATERESEEVRRFDAIYKVVKKQLGIVNDGRSYIIHIVFSSTSPQLAANIANKFAELYLAQQHEGKVAQVHLAVAWLEERLKELRKKIADAEIEAEDFRSRLGLLQAGGRPVVEQELTATIVQLVQASTERAQKQAAVQQQRQEGTSASEVNSLLIQRLREQEAQLLQENARLRSKYDPSFEAIRRNDAIIATYQQKIAREVKRINDSISVEFAISQAREAELKNKIIQLRKMITDADYANIQQRQLDGVVRSDREIYASYLTLYTKTAGEEAVQLPNAHLISKAQISGTPSSPKTMMLLALAAAGGIGLGLIWAVLLEQFNTKLYRTLDIERATQLPILGLVPYAIRRSTKFSIWQENAETSYWNGILNVRTALSLGSSRDRTSGRLPQSVLITSAMPNEGKSTFAMSLATSVAKMGCKTLVIECDLRHPSIARALGKPRATTGLSNILLGESSADSVIKFDERSGVHVICAGRHVADPQSLLNSHRMSSFLKIMQNDYEFIVLDSPPILAGADALALSTIVDTTVLVVRWGKTERASLSNAAKILWDYRGVVAGIVLNCVDIRRHKKYTPNDYGLVYAAESPSGNFMRDYRTF